MIAPILKYPGAKWRLAPWLVSHFVETRRYVSPYCGSAADYFALPWQPAHVVLNDRCGHIVNVFRVLRDADQRQRLIDAITFTPWARDEFESVQGPRGVLITTGEPVEDARRWLVRCWQASGTKLGTRTAWKHKGTTTAHTVETWRHLPDRLAAVVDRLLLAEIENRPALDVIQRYAMPDTFIYADPPYLQAERTTQLYQHEMTDEDHVDLLRVLRQHPGPVALSGYRTALYDDLLPDWQRCETTALAEHGQTRTECLWLNPVLVERRGYGPLFEV